MLLTPTLLSLGGMFVSLYGYFIEKKIKQNVTYRPTCDISDTISCSKPFLSPYSTMFGISNTILGISFYSIMLCLSLLEWKLILFCCSVMGVLVSVYLAYILATKIRSFCLVCTATYGINIALLIASYNA